VGPVRWEVLREIDGDDARALLALGRRRRFRRGDTIFHEGDRAESLHLVDIGHLAVRTTTPTGDVATLRLIGPGDHFGDLALVDASRRSAAIVAVDRVETLELRYDDLEQFRVEHPSFERVLLAMMARNVRRLSANLQDVMYLGVPARLARRLDELCELFEGEPLPLTQDDLAGLAGTTRQTVNQVLVELRDRGVVALGRGRITVVDRGALQRSAS
jgi:CRP/FNR family cyclic AMP-dependent transcriptional regulator